MSTQTSKLQLVKQANNENWSNDIHNANLQKLDNFAATIDPKKNNIVSLASDSTILNLDAGVYQIALSADSSYIPERWGTLIIDRSRVTYGCATFNSTTGKTYTRHMNGTANWHDSWQQLALDSQINSHFIDDLFIGNSQSRTYTLERFKSYLLIINYVSAGNVTSTFIAIVSAPNDASHTGKVTWLTSVPNTGITVTLSGLTFTVASNASNWITVAFTMV